LVHVLPGSDPVFSLAWSPDDSVLATGAIHFPAPSATGPAQLPGVVRLWRADGTLLHAVGTQFTGGKFLNLAWSPDGSRLAAGAGDYATWRADATPVANLLGGGPPAWAMAWAPDDRTLAIGNESGVLVLVTATGDTVGTAGFPDDVNALSFTADGRGLLVGLPDRVQFVNVADPSHVLWSAFTAGDGHVAWSPDGLRLAIAITNGLAVLRPDGSASAVLTGCPGDPVAFAWTGAVLAAATDQGQLCVWRAPPA
jgi:WD40 repeat protein